MGSNQHDFNHLVLLLCGAGGAFSQTTPGETCCPWKTVRNSEESYLDGIYQLRDIKDDKPEPVCGDSCVYVQVPSDGYDYCFKDLASSSDVVCEAPPTSMPTIPGTTVSLVDQAAETNNQLNTASAELDNAEDLSLETDKVASTIDAITGSRATTPSSRMKRAGHEITTPTDCSSFLNMLKDFNAAIGNNPRKANVTKGLLIAKALTSVDKDSISCDAQEVSSLKVMKEVTVVSVKSIVKQVVNLKKIEINVLISKIQEINNNLSNAGMSTVSVVVSTFAVSPTVPEPEEETNELGQTTTSFVETQSNETTDQYSVSTEGFGNETPGQYPSPGGNEATGQYPVSVDGMGNETTGQYPVPIAGTGNKTTGQYPIPVDGMGNETTGQYPVPIEGAGN